MASQLATLQQVQNWLADTAPSDALSLTSLLTAASDAIIQALGFDPTSQGYVENVSGTGSPFIFPTFNPINNVAAINVISGLTAGVQLNVWGAGNGVPQTPIDMTQVSFDKTRIFYTSGQVFPRGNSNLQVTYNAGYLPAQIPGSITQAVLLTAKAMVNSQAVDPNVSNESFSGVMSRSYWPEGAGAIPRAAMALIQPYRKIFAMP
jgi:hypothetical protein